MSELKDFALIVGVIILASVLFIFCMAAIVVLYGSMLGGLVAAGYWAFKLLVELFA